MMWRLVGVWSLDSGLRKRESPRSRTLEAVQLVIFLSSRTELDSLTIAAALRRKIKIEAFAVERETLYCRESAVG